MEELSKESEVKINTSHNDSIDGLKTIGVIAICAYHAGVPGTRLGWLSVELFCALSGFLITTHLIKQYQKTRQIKIREFWRQRIIDRFPAYYLYIGLLSLFFLIAQVPMTFSDSWSPTNYILSFWLFFNNFLPRGGFTGFDELTYHLWLICLIVQFYVVWPFVFSQIISRRWSCLIPLGVLALMMVCRPLISEFGLKCLPQGRGISILIGCTVALLLFDLRGRGNLYSWLISSRTRLAICLGSIILYGFLLVALPRGWVNSLEIYRWFVPMFALSCSLIIGSLWYGSDDFLTKILSWKPLVYLGRISFGIFLYHMFAHYVTWYVLLNNIESWPNFLKFGLRLMVYGLICVGIAALSYHFYENFFFKFKKSS